MLVVGVELDAVLPLDDVSAEVELTADLESDDDVEFDCVGPVCAASELSDDVDFGGSGFVLLLDEWSAA